MASQLRELVGDGVEAARLATGFGFLEGPVWHPDGYVLFSDLAQDVRRSWSETGGVTELRQPNARANGMALDAHLRLIVCEHVTSQVVREEEGRRDVLASHWTGFELNSPNDAVVHSDGSVYFTDPWYGRLPAHGLERPRELDFQGVYRIGPAGALELLVDDFAMPNGLCFSPDKSLLYVDDTPRAHIRVFDVLANGSLGVGRIFCESIGTGDAREGVVDGMRCDARGNVWVTGPGGIWVIDPRGEHLGTVGIPEVASNLAWGGDDLGTLYVTATSSLYALRTLIGPARLPHHRV